MLDMLLGCLPPSSKASALKLRVSAGAQEKININFRNAKGVITLQDGSKQSYDYGPGTIRTITLPTMAGDISITIEAKSDPCYMYFTGSNTRITEVIEWKNIPPNIGIQLSGCWNLTKVPSVAPAITSFQSLFRNCFAFNQDISGWDTSHVTNMNFMFGACAAFDKPLNNWNVSGVTDIGFMFSGCSVFNQPLNNWNVNSVANMELMFQNCTKFNQNLSSLTFPLVSVLARNGYDTNATAWEAINKPNFAIKT